MAVVTDCIQLYGLCQLFMTLQYSQESQPMLPEDHFAKLRLFCFSLCFLSATASNLGMVERSRRSKALVLTKINAIHRLLTTAGSLL